MVIYAYLADDLSGPKSVSQPVRQSVGLECVHKVAELNLRNCLVNANYFYRQCPSLFLHGWFVMQLLLISAFEIDSGIYNQ